MERWGFLFSVVNSPTVYFLMTTRAVCPNINPVILCTHVCDISYAACYCEIQMAERISLSVTSKAVGKCLERACIHSRSSCPWWSLVKFLLFDHESLTKQHLLKEINESRNISYNYCWIIIG